MSTNKEVDTTKSRSQLLQLHEFLLIKKRKILEKTFFYSVDYLIIYFLADSFLRYFHLFKEKFMNLQ